MKENSKSLLIALEESVKQLQEYLNTLNDERRVDPTKSKSQAFEYRVRRIRDISKE